MNAVQSLRSPYGPHDRNGPRPSFSFPGEDVTGFPNSNNFAYDLGLQACAFELQNQVYTYLGVCLFLGHPCNDRAAHQVWSQGRGRWYILYRFHRHCGARPTGQMVLASLSSLNRDHRMCLRRPSDILCQLQTNIYWFIYMQWVTC